MEDLAFLSQFISEPIYIVHDTISRPTPVYEGTNSKNVVIIIDFDISENTELASWFEKVLKAASLDFDSIALIKSSSLENKEYNLPSANHVLIMGGINYSLIPDLGFKETNTYSVLVNRNQKTLVVDSIQDIYANQLLKKKLWDKMKELFELK